MQTLCNYLTMQDDLRKYSYIIFYFIYIIMIYNGDERKFILKRLLKSTTKKREKEKIKLLNDLERSTKDIRNALSGLDFFTCERAINKNVNVNENNYIKLKKRS